MRVLVGEGKSSENYLIVDGQQRVLSLLLLLNVWHVKVGDMKYSREQISFNPTRYVLEVGKRGLDLSEGMRAHLGLKDVDTLKRKYASEYVERLLGLCERIASYRIPVYFKDLDDEKSPLERAAEIFVLANRAPSFGQYKGYVGVDLNHRSPGYEPGGMDLATLPRLQLHNARRLFKCERLIPQHIPQSIRAPLVGLLRMTCVDTKRVLTSLLEPFWVSGRDARY